MDDVDDFLVWLRERIAARRALTERRDYRRALAEDARRAAEVADTAGDTEISDSRKSPTATESLRKARVEWRGSTYDAVRDLQPGRRLSLGAQPDR